MISDNFSHCGLVKHLIWTAKYGMKPIGVLVKSMNNFKACEICVSSFSIEMVKKREQVQNAC
jgi:hypothetical protein